MKNYGQVGTYVSGTTGRPLARPTKRRRGHIAVQPRCKKCSLPLAGRGDHLCLDLSAPEPVIERPKTASGRRKPMPRTSEHSMNLSTAARESWAKKNAPRNALIVARYSEGGVGIIALAREFGTSRTVISKALHEAAEQGLIEVRKPGHTIAKGA